MKNKKPKMTAEEWVSQFIGEVIGKCPDCESNLYGSPDGTKWCSECSYSNKKEITDFINSLGDKK